VRLDYDSDLERLEGLLEEATAQRDQLILSLEQVQADQRTRQGTAPCLNCIEL
jgi:hypothetical protein